MISDWIFGLRDAAASLAAGLDVEMPYRMVRAQHLPGALERDEVSWADVDRAVERVVATLLRFDHVLSAPAPPTEVVGSHEHRALAREVAARSVVLLRNEPVDATPVLPLTRDRRIAVIGPLADTVNVGDGGSSDVWDLECRTVLDGLRSALDHVVHDDGADPSRAAGVARSADVAVVVVGCTHLDEGEYIGPTAPTLAELFPATDEPEVVARFDRWVAEVPPARKPPHLEGRTRGFSSGGDRTSLRLAADHVELIEAVAAANPRTVVVVQAGSAVVMSEWIGEVPAVVQAWYGGCQAGPGLADVLLGDVNPSARLPFSVPVAEADLPRFERDATRFAYDRWHGWWHLARTGTSSAFPFGFGLSYTTFELGGVEVSGVDDALIVRATLANTGDRDGADVVQVYVELPDPEAPPRLAGFARVDVAAGAEAEIELRLPLHRFATRDAAARRWVPGAGRHPVTVARFAGDPDAVTVTVRLPPPGT